MTSKEKARELLSHAGVEINGQQPWDISVHDERLYNRIFAEGSLGVGESYMDGWWDAPALDQLFYKCFSAALDEKLTFNARTLFHLAKAALLNRQSKHRAFEVGQEHYDAGNDLFEKMLDQRMVYTCGYWSSPKAPAKNLNEAQEAKLDLVCRKLSLRPGMRVLDIGCGWGSFLKFAAEKYGVSGVGVTVSKEQVALARERCKGLPVEIRLQDYRDLNEQFDAVVSLGMFEHVGYKNYRQYMEVAARCLKDNGLFLLHSIGYFRSVTAGDAWLDKYIFPNGMLPSVAQIGRAIEKHFIMEDWHNFGADYDKTLMAWLKNFDDAWPELKTSYSERFRRMWRFYLAACAGQFRARKCQLWQVVLSKEGVPGGYLCVR